VSQPCGKHRFTQADVGLNDDMAAVMRGEEPVHRFNQSPAAREPLYLRIGE
jgi:hypothetical protein